MIFQGLNPEWPEPAFFCSGSPSRCSFAPAVACFQMEKEEALEPRCRKSGGCMKDYFQAKARLVLSPGY
jgi:hypothetical protein